jgi:hypothetical protein
VTVFGGDVIYAADINNVEAKIPRFVSKAVSTPRASTVTLADDPELSGIALAVGTYEIQLTLFMSFSTSAAAKLKTRWAFSGTWNNPNRLILGPGAAQVAAPNVATEANVQATQASGQDAVYSGPVSVIWSNALELASTVVVTVAGNLSLQWAQQVSTAANVNVNAGTSFRITKIA